MKDETSSKGRWVLAWLATLICAPAAFVAALIAIAFTYAALTGKPLFIMAMPIILEVVGSIPILILMGIFAGVTATGPALVIGAPAAMALHDLRIRSYVAWTVVGATLGLLGGFAIIMTNRALNCPIPSLMDPNLSLLASLYGAVTAALFRAFSGAITPGGATP